MRSSDSIPWRSATTLCWWIVSGFSWRGGARSRPRGEAPPAEPLARTRGDELLRAGAGGHPRRRDAHRPARAVLVGDRAAVERVDLLRLDAGDRRRLVLWVAGGDRHFG